MGSNHSQINKEGRICTRCGVFKAWVNFYGDKHSITKHQAHCIKCELLNVKKRSVNPRYPKPAASEYDKNGHQKMGNTDLAFLLNIKRISKNSWTLEQARILLKAIEIEAMKGEAVNFKKIFARYGSGHSPQGCNLMLKELKAAANNKMTLEQYFIKGRPFSLSAKQNEPVVKE